MESGNPLVLERAGVEVGCGKELRLYGYEKGLQSPEVMVVKVIVGEGDPFIVASDGDQFGRKIDRFIVTAQGQVDFYLLSHPYTFIRPDKQTAQTYVFQYSLEQTIGSQRLDVIINLQAAEKSCCHEISSLTRDL